MLATGYPACARPFVPIQLPLRAAEDTSELKQRGREMGNFSIPWAQLNCSKEMRQGFLNSAATGESRTTSRCQHAVPGSERGSIAARYAGPNFP
jgi:hypothetical protein